MLGFIQREVNSSVSSGTSALRDDPQKFVTVSRDALERMLTADCIKRSRRRSFYLCPPTRRPNIRGAPRFGSGKRNRVNNLNDEEERETFVCRLDESLLSRFASKIV